MFETTFWGVSNMTRAVLSHLRGVRSGRILNVTSICGLTSVPTFGYYNSTKFAVEDLMDALRQEVSPLGIQITNIDPGPFQADWSGRSMSGSEILIPD
jgi:NADP-dependent 3-hydroxy acid dehydrogenase YdfG